MSNTKLSESSFSPRSSGSGVNSQGSTTPRNSGRNSREDLLNDSYGSYGSNPDLRYNINEELDYWRHGVTRRGSYTNFKEGRLFSEVLDELEYQIRKAEDDSSALLHDFNVLRNQHQSQSRRINDLLRGFEEARYTLDHMRGGRYRKRSHLKPGEEDERSSLRRESSETLARRGSLERFERKSSLDRMERKGSFERRGSFDRMERRPSLERVERRGSSDSIERRNSLDRRGSSDHVLVKKDESRGYHKSGSDHSFRSPERDRSLKAKTSSRILVTSSATESRC